MTYLNEYGFTGIDFDLEIKADANSHEANYLDELCAAIKNENESLLITAAPQVNQADHSTDIYLVSAEHFRLYDQAVNNNRFDYIFVQAYNNSWPQVNGCGQTNVCFISEGFRSLLNSIPATTLIAIGEPANANAAGTSPFTGPENGPEIYDRIAAQYELICDEEQCGGAMVWSVGHDRDTEYQFVKAVHKVFNPA